MYNNQFHVNLSKSQATNLQRRAVEVLLHGIEFTMKKVTHPQFGALVEVQTSLFRPNGYLQKVPTIFLLKRIGSNLVGLQEKFGPLKC